MRARFVATLIAGPALYLLLVLLAPATLAIPARHVLGTAAWMAVWWVTEPVPLAATSLLPVALFPTLGVVSAREAVAPYANELVFLFLAGFLLAAALERWLADTSGYDETTWPLVERLIAENRLSERDPDA